MGGTLQTDMDFSGVDEVTALARLQEVSTVVLRQAVDLVNNSLTSDEQLTVHSQFMPGSTIGAWIHTIHQASLIKIKKENT